MLKRVQMKQDHSSLQEQQLNTLYSDVRQIFETSRIHAVRSVDFCRVQMYWHLGQRIFKEEQQGKERIPESPTEIIKDPMVLEFLGLHRESSYYEKDLESAIITHLTDFLLEMGKGFSFVSRQKRLLIEDEEFFADLVFYNRLLRCHVVIELKTGKLTHQDLGQLQMYVNYYDRYEKLPDENSTIGILLCTEKNDTVVRMTLPENNQSILASEYKLYLPSSEQLIKEIDQVKKLAKKIEKENEK